MAVGLFGASVVLAGCSILGDNIEKCQDAIETHGDDLRAEYARLGLPGDGEVGCDSESGPPPYFEARAVIELDEAEALVETLGWEGGQETSSADLGFVRERDGLRYELYLTDTGGAEVIFYMTGPW